MMLEAVFFDRDGVINYDSGYVIDQDKFHVLPGIFEIVRFLNNSKIKVIIITNQSGIGRGLFSQKQYENLNHFITNLFREKNCYIDGIYTCSHSPSENCNCRKPVPLLINKASEEHNLNKKNALLIGDKITDILSGRNAGVGWNMLVEPNKVNSEGKCSLFGY